MNKAQLNSAKEKASELLKMYKYAFINANSSNWKNPAKKCAVYLVDEIIKNHIKHFDDAFPNVVEYWENVKTFLTAPAGSGE